MKKVKEKRAVNGGKLHALQLLTPQALARSRPHGLALRAAGEQIAHGTPHKSRDTEFK